MEEETGLTIAEAKQAIRLAPADRPTMLVGPPGFGKSSILRQVADELDEAYWCIYGALLETVEVNGCPRIFEREGRWWAEWAPFKGVFPLACESYPKRIRINIDDAGQATPSVLKALIRVFYGDGSERRMGQHAIYPDVRLCGTTNLHTHRAGAARFETYASNRVTFLPILPSYSEVADYLTSRDAHPLVVAFIVFTKMVSDFTPEKDAFMSPRSLESLSDWLKSLGETDGAIRRHVAVGTIGSDKGTEFVAFAALAPKMPNMDDLLAGKKVKLPVESEVQYMLVSRFIRMASEKHVPATARLILDLTEAGNHGFEVAAYLTHAALQGSATKLRGLRAQPDLYKWLQTYGKYLPPQ